MLAHLYFYAERITQPANDDFRYNHLIGFVFEQALKTHDAVIHKDVDGHH
jgi:hypothetical protein